MLGAGGLAWSVSLTLASLDLPGGRVALSSPPLSVTAGSHTAHMLDSYFRYCDNSLNSHQRENDKPSPVAPK